MKTAMAFVLGATVGVTGTLALQHSPVLAGMVFGPLVREPPKIVSAPTYGCFYPPGEDVCK